LAEVEDRDDAAIDATAPREIEHGFEARGPRHVLHDDVRITGEVMPDVAGEQAEEHVMRMAAALALRLAAVLVAVGPAAARDFYKGKTLTIVAGFPAGGGFDRNARPSGRNSSRRPAAKRAIGPRLFDNI
jgi:hypothetical protein